MKNYKVIHTKNSTARNVSKTKTNQVDYEYLKALQLILGEWATEEDEKAYCDL